MVTAMRSGKRSLIVSLFLILFFSFLGGRNAAAEGVAAPLPPPDVSARAAALMEAATGQVLYEKNGGERLPMASTTKIMTALVAIERGRLDDVITVSRAAANIDGSRVYLDEGERQTLRDLLYALLLESANDAAIAIAEHVAGSQDAFVAMMNQRARALGALDTHFRDPHGLSAQDHYTTARNLALITREALRNPTFAAIVRTKQYEIPWPARGAMRQLNNHNKLLWRDTDVTGVKTGYIPESGLCLVASAERGGRTLIAVLLNSDTSQDMYRDARRLLDYGFTAFETKRLVRAGEVVGRVELSPGMSVPVQAAADLLYALPKEAGADGIQKQVHWLGALTPPLSAGQVAGEMRVFWQGRAIGRIDLVTTQAVALPPLPHRGRRWDRIAGGVIAFVVLQQLGRWRRRRLRRLRRVVYLAPGRGLH